MTREEMLQEAMERMDLLGISRSVPDGLKDGKVYCAVRSMGLFGGYMSQVNPTGPWGEIIRTLEEEHHLLIYFVIYSEGPRGHKVYFLAVPNTNERDWSAEREQIAALREFGSAYMQQQVKVHVYDLKQEKYLGTRTLITELIDGGLFCAE